MLSDGLELKINLIAAKSNLGRLTAAPPGTPAEVVAELRDAYKKVMADPDFLAKAEILGLPITPARGDEVATLMRATLNQSPDTVAIISPALNVEIPTIKVKTDILALEDRNKVVTFMSGDAKVTGEVSGARTKVTVNGAGAERGDLAVGMVREPEYDPAIEVNEFKSIACSVEVFQAAVTMMMGEMSGSRTTVMVNGAEARRGDLADGMACDFAYEFGEKIEFKPVT